MNTSVTEARAKKLRFDKELMWVELTDGRLLGVPLAYFPRLLRATPRQRLKYEISGGGTGLHWNELNEDISVRGLLLGIPDLTTSRQSSRHQEKSFATEHRAP
jgi:hypothetical protein